MGDSGIQTQNRHFDWLSTLCCLNQPQESHDPPFARRQLGSRCFPHLDKPAPLTIVPECKIGYKKMNSETVTLSSHNPQGANRANWNQAIPRVPQSEY